MYAPRYPTFGTFVAPDMDPFAEMDRMMRAFEQDIKRSTFTLDSRTTFTPYRPRMFAPSARTFRIPIRTDEDTSTTEDMEMKKAVELSMKEQEKEKKRKQEELTEDEQLQLALELSKMEPTASEDDEEPLITHRRIREEQDLAFEEALKIDQERERIHEDQMEVQTEQEALDLSLKLTRESRYQHALQVLAPEPDASDLDSTHLVIRLPNGTRLERRFCIYEKVEQLRAFVDSKLMELDCIPLEYDVVSDFPKRVYADNQKTFLHAGLTPRALVSILERE